MGLIFFDGILRNNVKKFYCDLKSFQLCELKIANFKLAADFVIFISLSTSQS